MQIYRKQRDWGKIANMYSLRDGFIYTAPSAFPLWTSRQPAVILLSLAHSPFQIESSQGCFEGAAMVVAPQVARSIDAQCCGLISIHIEPSHPAFLGLARSQKTSSIVVLPRDIFANYDNSLMDVYEGHMSAGDTRALFDAVVNASAVYLCASSERDGRIASIMQQLVDASPLDYNFEAMANTLHLSASRFSHLFTAEGGLALRSFLMWRKTKEAIKLIGSRASLTDIAHESGFSDSAHFSRTLKMTLGVTPSWIADSSCVQVFHWENL
jgi:AraC family transcriptional regulator, arabinose operon regulatory protein